MKIELKRITGEVAFSHDCENNSVKVTLLEAVRSGANLRGSDLRGSDLSDSNLRFSDLSDSNLRGSNLSGHKIKTAAVFMGLYKYIVIPYITDKDERRVKMGCHDRSLEEWENNFWNNEREFPNDGSLGSNLRKMAFETAKAWFDLIG